MIVQTDALEISTIYGKLTVPIGDVQSIEFGLHFPAGVEAKIGAALKNLGSNDYREREKAGKVLVDLGRYSYPALLTASRAKEAEVAKRAKELVQKLQTKLPKKDLKTMREDRLVTPTHTIVGRILTPMVKTKADYFGEMEHQIANMRTLRAVAGPGLDLEFSLDAVKYANQGQWMETDYQVDGRSTILITAKGQVDTWPQQPGGYMTGPDGVQAGRGINMPGGRIGIRGQIGQINPQMYGGMVFGKIGDDGEPFIVGSRYEGKPEAEGKLYLHIGPSPWNCPSSGTYDIKISRKGD
jgi:hypothetical protein